MKATDLSPAKRALKFTNKVNNAVQRGIKFTLSLTQWDELFNNNPVCYYSGQPFSSLDDITVERVDSRKGYEAGNVVLCTDKANNVKAHLDAFEKADLPVDVLIRMMRKSLYRLEKRKKELDKLQAKRDATNPMQYVKAAMKRGKTNG